MIIQTLLQRLPHRLYSGGGGWAVFIGPSVYIYRLWILFCCLLAAERTAGVSWCLLVFVIVAVFLYVFVVLYFISACGTLDEGAFHKDLRASGPVASDGSSFAVLTKTQKEIINPILLTDSS